jgi:asparagine synthase (glutamine-hydrolysing)
MANILKTLVSMLDNRVIQMASSLPPTLKFLRSQSEWLRCDISFFLMLKKPLESPNAGCEIPLHICSCGPWRGWTEVFSSDETSRAEGHFHPSPIKDMWLERFSEKRDRQQHLWTIPTRQGRAAYKPSSISLSLDTA